MESTLFVIPSFSHQKELLSVLEQLASCHVLVVDDGSPTPLFGTKNIIRHPQNKGYGAAQKTGFSFALSHGFSRVVLVHGDNQYSVEHLKKQLQTNEEASVQLGSRFLHHTPQNMPHWRRLGNRVLTSLVNARWESHFSDLHTGARIYKREVLEKIPYFSFSDDFVFDHQLLLWCIKQNISIEEFPMPAKYDETVSSISFSRSLTYGIGCLLGILAT